MNSGKGNTSIVTHNQSDVWQYNQQPPTWNTEICTKFDCIFVRGFEVRANVWICQCLHLIKIQCEYELTVPRPYVINALFMQIMPKNSVGESAIFVDSFFVFGSLESREIVNYDIITSIGQRNGLEMDQKYERKQIDKNLPVLLFTLYAFYFIRRKRTHQHSILIRVEVIYVAECE